MNDLVISHLMDVKSDLAAQRELIEGMREDVKGHAEVHQHLTKRLAKLEVWPQTAKVVVKILLTIAGLITSGYGAMAVLQDRPAQHRQEH